MKKVWQMLHILRRCGAWCFVQISGLEKLCNCSKSSGKKEEHLGILFRANLNVSASLRGSAEMHLWSDSRKCDRYLHIETPTWWLNWSANMSWDAKRNLNQRLWQLVIFLCKSLVFGFTNTDSFCYFKLQCLQSPNKIYIWVPNTYGYPLQKIWSNSVDSLERYSWFVSDFALPWQQ
jgi:hypothetical protein